jgi:biotin synthase
MNTTPNRERIDRLRREKSLPDADWQTLFADFSEADAAYAAETARDIAVARFGRRIFFRGLIEFTNYCKNDCYYCGIRRSNARCQRYRLEPPDILACCAAGYDLGFRTFVLQGGEDGYWDDDRLSALVASIRGKYPDCAITLSVGERTRASYQRLFGAGANRYLLRHETADPAHYAALHPAAQTLETRLECLKNLKDIGYQVGCGMMIGAPGQTPATLAADMRLLDDFRPHMVGIGPFIPHGDTPLADAPPGSVSLTLFALSLTRIMLPDALIPATTALGTLRQDGRALGVLAGCNVVMPNLSPTDVRAKYMLYDGKAGVHTTAARGLRDLTAQMAAIGYAVAPGRGDYLERSDATC